NGKCRTNADLIQWNAFELFWVGIAGDIESQKAVWRGEAEPCMGTQGFPREGNSRVRTDGGTAGVLTKHEDRTSKDEPHPERVRPPSVADTNVIFLNEKEGIQGGEAEGLSTNSDLPAGLSYDEACNIVSRYCQPFHWDNLTHEDFEAAVAAEQRKAGAGRAVVNELALQRAKQKGDITDEQ